MTARPTVGMFVPAFQRFELTRVCLEQRARLCAELAGRGIDAFGVVVADDENLDTARDVGFAAIEAPNLLGARVNAGIGWALGHGADYVCLTGSDDWVHADHFSSLPDDLTIGTSHNLGVVDETGMRLALCHVDHGGGAGPLIFPRFLLELFGPEWVEPHRMRGIHANLFQRMSRVRLPVFEFNDFHEVQLVDFKSSPQITSYESLLGPYGVAVDDDPWGVLAAAYPADLVAGMAAVYAEAGLVAA